MHYKISGGSLGDGKHRVSSKHNNYFFLLQNTIFPTIFGVALKIVAYL